MLVVTGVIAELARLATSIVYSCSVAFDELYSVGKDDTTILRLDSEVVCDQLNRPFVSRSDS